MKEQLYELPGGWEYHRIGEVASLVSGQHLKKDEYTEFENNGSIPYLTGPADFGELYPNPTRWTKTRRSVAISGDTLITVKGSGVGKVNLMSAPEIAISRQLMAVRASGLLDTDFLYLFFLAKQDIFAGKKTGAAIPGIGRNDVLDQIITFPPLNEQKSIVTKLDALFTRIDRAIAHLQQTLKLSKALFASALKAEVSGEGNDWPVLALSSLGEFSGGGTPTKSNRDYWDGEIPWITPKDMKSPELADSEMKITSLGVTQSSAKMLPANSVLIVARSGILRHTLPVCINRVEATVNQDIKVFIPSKRVTSEYIQYLLKGNEAFILSQLVKGGVTVESLKYEEFQNYAFPVPNLIEQKSIVTHLDALYERTKTLEVATQEKLNDLTTLKASILDAAFKGQL